MTAALYARVSTEDQDCSMQLSELRAWAKRIGARIVEIPPDTMSGGKARRPGLDKVIELARAGKIDAIAVWKLDRFGRSMIHMLSLVQELRRLNVRLICTSQGIDTDTQTPAGDLQLHILAAVAEFERQLIRERTALGLKHAKEHGTRSGKAIGRPKMIFRRDQVAGLKAQGLSLREIANRLGVGRGTVARTLQAASQNPIT